MFPSQLYFSAKAKSLVEDDEDGVHFEMNPQALGARDCEGGYDEPPWQTSISQFKELCYMYDEYSVDISFYKKICQFFSEWLF